METNKQTPQQLEVSVISNDFYETQEVLNRFTDDADIAIGGIYRAYHADAVFGESEGAPDIIVGNGKVKDRLPERPSEAVSVRYPSRSKAKEAGIPYVRQRHSPKATEKAIRRASKKINKH
jgi:hypothetical protein